MYLAYSVFNFLFQIVVYLRMCLAQKAGLNPTPVLSQLQDQAPVVAACVSQLLSQNPGDDGPVICYVDMLRQLLTAVSSNDALL